MTTTVYKRSQYFLTVAAVLVCLTIIICVLSLTQLNTETVFHLTRASVIVVLIRDVGAGLHPIGKIGEKLKLSHHSH